MKNVFFKPWVGEQYEKEGFSGKKILVLGESHYCGDECEGCGNVKETGCANFTTNVINDFLNYKNGKNSHKYWMNTFTRFTNIFLGEKVNSDKINAFWDSVIFYNYVQFALTGPRMAPNSQNFTDSSIAFFEVINKYKPDLIIVWGERLWDQLPNNGIWGDAILDGKNGKLYYYNVAEKNIPAFNIYHPSSSAFSYEDSKYLQEAFRLA